MRAAAFFLLLLVALVAAAPDMMAEKAKERELCVGASFSPFQPHCDPLSPVNLLAGYFLSTG